MSLEDGSESSLLDALSEANCSTSTRSVPLEQAGYKENEKNEGKQIK